MRLFNLIGRRGLLAMTALSLMAAQSPVLAQAGKIGRAHV